MSKLIQVKPEVNRLIQYLSWIEEGRFRIPTFQRDFIWDTSDKRDLFDSLSKEYPIGSLLIWQPKEQFASKTEIGSYTINNNTSNEYSYVLDGFQRLSTLFGCLTNPNKTNLLFDKNKLKKEFTFYYNLEDGSFETSNANNDIFKIPLYALIDTYEFLDYCDRLRSIVTDNSKSKIMIDRAKKLSSTLIDYQIPVIKIEGGGIKEAVEIFSRINSMGQTISPDWMLSALTSSENDNFNLGEILEGLVEDLKVYNFEDIKRDVLVQCIQNSFGKIYFDQTIEDLVKKPNFMEITYRTISSIKKSIKFLFEEILVIDRKLLPYNNQLIFLTSFFNEVENPTLNQIKALKKWFWITTYSNYFTIFSLSKIRSAFEHFKKFISADVDEPVYYERVGQTFSIADLPKTVSMKSVRSNAMLLFMLNHSNNFERIDSQYVDALKLTYLFSGINSHDNVLPLIDYTIDYITTTTSDLLLNNDKKKDMSFILTDENLNRYGNKYFLDQNMALINQNEEEVVATEKILALRHSIIKSAELDFIDRLGGMIVSD